MYAAYFRAQQWQPVELADTTGSTSSRRYYSRERVFCPAVEAEEAYDGDQVRTAHDILFPGHSYQCQLVYNPSDG